MTTPSRTRLVRDYKRLKHDPPEGINASPNPSNIMHWNAVIFGPEDTPWDGGTFKLTMEFSEDYPNRAPVVKFVSKMFHPNIYQDGSICLDILQKQWSPIYDVWAILTSIQSLLTDPNPNSPANQEAAKLFSDNKKLYLEQVQACVERSWMESSGELQQSSSDEKGSLLKQDNDEEDGEEVTGVIESKSVTEEDSKESPSLSTEEKLDRCSSREDNDGKVYKRLKREEA